MITSPHRPLSRARIAALGVSLSVAGFLSGWWLIGEQSEPDLAHPDHLVSAPQVATPVTIVVGTLATTIAAIVLIRLWTQRRRLAAVVILVCGVALAFVARVVTAGVGGANIGGALAAYVVLPAIAIVLSAAFVFLVVSAD